MRIKCHISFLFTVFVACLLCACDDNDEVLSDSTTFSDIALILPKNGANQQFVVWQGEDSPRIILDAGDFSLNPKVFKDGDRTLISYRYIDKSTQAYTHGKISVVGITDINNDRLRISDLADNSNWNATPVTLISIWRNECYISIFSRLTVTKAPRHFFLMADKNTVNNPYPDLYLVHDIVDSPDNFVRRNYASFDISEIWNKTECLGVNIHIATTNHRDEVFSFKK